MDNLDRLYFAEWLGYNLTHITVDTYISPNFKMKATENPLNDYILFKKNEPIYYFDDYRPDTWDSPYQFIEIWKNLTEKQRSRVRLKYWEDKSNYIYFEDAILFDLPNVLAAIKYVLEMETN